MIESFRHHTPVIARRTGPFPEVVEAVNGGLLFSTTDELVSAIRRLHEDQALRDGLAANAYMGGRERWSEDAVISRFLGLIDKART